MTRANLDNGIVLGNLLPPRLRLLVLVVNKDVRDVDWLKGEMILLMVKGGVGVGDFYYLCRKIQSLGNFPCWLFLSFHLSPS